jgi:hypothetical protein
MTEGAVGVSSRSSTDRYTNHRERLSGLFTPPTTGDYTFFVTGDDTADLYLSPTPSAAGMVRIATLGGHKFQAEPWTEAGQVSAPMRLVAGTPYFIQLVHSQGVGPGWVRVGVQVHNTTAAGGCPVSPPLLTAPSRP